MNKYQYIGAFLNREALYAKEQVKSREHLDRLIDAPHVTFQYLPEEVNENLFGEPVRLKVTGYGKDGDNEGLRVEIIAENPEIQEMAKSIPLPHVTISISTTGKAVNTRFLEFADVKPFFLEATFGVYEKDTKKTTLH